MKEITIKGKLKPQRLLISFDTSGDVTDVLFKYLVVDDNGRVLQYKSIKLDNFIGEDVLVGMRQKLKQAVEQVFEQEG